MVLHEWMGALALATFAGMSLVAGLVRRAAAHEHGTAGIGQRAVLAWTLLAMAAAGVAAVGSRLAGGTVMSLVATSLLAGLVAALVLDGGRALLGSGGNGRARPRDP